VKDPWNRQPAVPVRDQDDFENALGPTALFLAVEHERAFHAFNVFVRGLIVAGRVKMPMAGKLVSLVPKVSVDHVEEVRVGIEQRKSSPCCS
jgi:hypothetical protein